MDKPVSEILGDFVDGRTENVRTERVGFASGADTLVGDLYLPADAGAAVPDGARRFHDVLPGQKEIIWRDGGQMDFYDQDSHVEPAMDAVAKHFASTL